MPFRDTAEAVAQYEQKLYNGMWFDPPPVPDVSGPIPGALNVDDGCESVGGRLNSWTRYVLPTEFGCQYSPAITADTPGAVPSFIYEREQELRRSGDPYYNRVAHRDRDERPYFSDPVPLSFDPLAICRTDTGADEEGVAFRRVWIDPLVRTIWLSIKSRHLTSQHFRRECIRAARYIRFRPPLCAEELHLPMSLPLYFKVQLYPYVTRILMREKHWPYLHPGKVNVAAQPLRWAYTPKAATASGTPESA